jgi:hypothetical protein
VTYGARKVCYWVRPNGRAEIAAVRA